MRGKQTNFGVYPPEKIAFHMRTRPGAAAVGPACKQVIAGLLADDALYRLGGAQGVTGLGDKARPRAGWKQPARRRSPSGTPPTGPSKAS
jgi:hypothetical protein